MEKCGLQGFDDPVPPVFYQAYPVVGKGKKFSHFPGTIRTMVVNGNKFPFPVILFQDRLKAFGNIRFRIPERNQDTNQWVFHLPKVRNSGGSVLWTRSKRKTRVVTMVRGSSYFSEYTASKPRKSVIIRWFL
jgi:hypothetical protein